MLTYDVTKSSKSFMRAEPKPAAPVELARFLTNKSQPFSDITELSWRPHTQRIAPCFPLFESYSCLFSLTLLPFHVLTPLVLATNAHIPPKLGTHPKVKAGNLQSTKICWEDPTTHRTEPHSVLLSSLFTTGKLSLRMLEDSPPSCGLLLSVGPVLCSGASRINMPGARDFPLSQTNQLEKDQK